MPTPSASSARTAASLSALTVGRSMSLSALGAFDPGARNAGIDTLDQDGAFQFREDAAHLKHRAASWRAGIEPMLVKVEVAIASLQLCQKAD